MQDKVIVCRDCKSEFTFTVGEQEFYAERDFSDPVRCKDCRKTRNRDNDNTLTREMFDAFCTECYIECKVPFEPIDKRPVYCSSCFQSKKQN
jgi:CxxC-x17-CxxC domain-containing protein